MGVIACATSIAGVLLFASGAVAQAPPEETPAQAPPEETAARRDEARQLFARGEVAFAEGRLADARRLFRQSLDLHPHQATAFNLALAMREAGAYLDSDALYAELLDGRFGALDEERRREVAGLRAEVRARIGRLRVRVHGAARSEVLVDGRIVARAASSETTEAEVDPGEHVATARAADYLPVDETVHVEAGETVSIRLALTEPIGRAPIAVGPVDSGGASLWPWIALAAAVAVAGAAVTVLLLTGDDEPDLPPDLVFGRATTLRW